MSRQRYIFIGILFMFVNSKTRQLRAFGKEYVTQKTACIHARQFNKRKTHIIKVQARSNTKWSTISFGDDNKKEKKTSAISDYDFGTSYTTNWFWAKKMQTATLKQFTYWTLVELIVNHNGIFRNRKASF